MCPLHNNVVADTPPAALHSYGARLATFLLRRRSTPSYQPNAKASDTRTSTMTTASRAGFWLSVSALYACMFTPVYCTMRAGGALRSAQVALPLMFAGLALEAVADEQKQAAKKAKPDSFVSTGGWLAGLAGLAAAPAG